MRRCGSGHFQGTSSSTATHIFLCVWVCVLHGLFQQKGNRCAVMSTVDYSRNIARKICAPAAQRSARTDLSVKISPSLSLSTLARRAAFFKGDEERSWQLPVQHRRQRHKPTCPHPLLVHVTAALLFPKHRERSAHALSVLVQVDLQSAGRHLSGYWMWYTENAVIRSSWVPVWCLLKLRCRAPCSTFSGNCL